MGRVYLDQASLSRLIRSADVVVLPYDSTEQVTSGVLIEAVGAGVPVVATEFPHAVELLADGARPARTAPGPGGDGRRRSGTCSPRRAAGRLTGLAGGPTLRWPAVAARYQALAARLLAAAARCRPRPPPIPAIGLNASSGSPVSDPAVGPPPVQLSTRPLRTWRTSPASPTTPACSSTRRNAIVRREHGYCVDDVSRGAAGREPGAAAHRQVVALAERYLAFLTHAQGPDGAFRNRLSYDRRWLDEPRWATGGAARCGAWAPRRPAARCRGSGPRRAARSNWAPHRRSPWPRAMAFAGLGAAEILRADPHDAGGRACSATAATVIGLPGRTPTGRGRSRASPTPTRRWPRWSSPPATCSATSRAAARPADARLAAARQKHDGHLSAVPVGGWRPGGQPASTSSRSRRPRPPTRAPRAAAVTGDERWARRCSRRSPGSWAITTPGRSCTTRLPAVVMTD